MIAITITQDIEKPYIELPHYDSSSKVKEINMNNIIWKMSNTDIKRHTYYFFHDMINIKNLDLNKIKIDKKSYKNIFIYYVGNVTVKDL